MDSRRAWDKERYYYLKSLGLCVKCGSHVEPERAGKVNCGSCQKSEYERIRGWVTRNPEKNKRCQKNWLVKHPEYHKNWRDKFPTYMKDYVANG